MHKGNKMISIIMCEKGERLGPSKMHWMISHAGIIVWKMINFPVICCQKIIGFDDEVILVASYLPMNRA